jgi:glycosyltransferase involved in cell wall biosynthesis
MAVEQVMAPDPLSSQQHPGDSSLKPHLLCIGGEDHRLRIPFLLALRDMGFRISAAASGDPLPFVRAGLDYHRINFGRFINPLIDYVAFNSISKLIADARPELVQTFDTKPAILTPLAARRLHDVGIISTINGLGWLYSSRSPRALALRPVYGALQRLANRWTEVTVFQNADDQAFFERQMMVSKGKHLMIPGSGIDIKRFEHVVATEPSPSELRRALGLSASSEVVMTVTRLTRQKGIPTLLEAAALVHRDRPGVRFLLVGPHENEGSLAVDQGEIDRHAPYVQAIGPRSDIPALLGVADVFAFPTELREGIPRVLLEAAVAARPIVTTRMPGCTDVIRDGWNGFLVPPHSPRLLANRILDLLCDRKTASAMGARAATFVRQEFNLDITVARYAAVYEQLLKCSKHGDVSSDVTVIGSQQQRLESSA